MTTPPAQDADRLPRDVEWALEGRLVEASNVVVRLVAPGGERAVFKPVRGERPLSDFPPASLAHREVATYLVAAAAGLHCVPETTWHVDPQLGEGSLQRWVGPLEPAEQHQVALLDEDELTDDVHAIAAFDTDEGPLVLAHHDGDALRDDIRRGGEGEGDVLRCVSGVLRQSGTSGRALVENMAGVLLYGDRRRTHSRIYMRRLWALVVSDFRGTPCRLVGRTMTETVRLPAWPGLHTF